MLAGDVIRTLVFDLEIFSDASLNSWGACCGKERAQGVSSESERLRHINYLEILAAFLALTCFARNLFDKQVLLRIDNVTALAHINKMGGTKHLNIWICTT